MIASRYQMLEINDERLMASIQDRDPSAIAHLYDRHSSIIKALILRIIHNNAEAEDLLQEVFIDLWNHADRFSPEKGKPLNWLLTLTRRRAIDRLRKSQAYTFTKERFHEEEEIFSFARTSNRTDDIVEHSEIRNMLLTVIHTLPLKQQESIELVFFKGMTQHEIAFHTDTPLSTVKTRLELGLRKIANALTPYRYEL